MYLFSLWISEMTAALIGMEWCKMWCSHMGWQHHVTWECTCYSGQCWSGL